MTKGVMVMSREIDIQERTFRYACRIVQLYDYLQTKRGAARSLSRQLLDSGTSVGSNMEEAHAGESRADFISKCGVALKEARESRYWLRVIAECRAVDKPPFLPLVQEATDIIAILTTIRKKAREKIGK